MLYDHSCVEAQYHFGEMSDEKEKKVKKCNTFIITRISNERHYKM